MQALVDRSRELTSSAIHKPNVPLDAVLHEALLAEFTAVLVHWVFIDPDDAESLDALRNAGRSICIAFADLGDALEMITILINELIADNLSIDRAATERLFHGGSIAAAAGARSHVSLRLLSSLTQLPQLSAFKRDLASSIVGSNESSIALAVVFIDLDGLKRINDGEGHTHGDRAIRGLADALQSSSDNYDAGLYHLHGDEFGLIVRGPDATRVPALIRGVKRRARRLDRGGRVVTIQFSAGFALYPDDGRTADELIDVADDRMQADKRRRRMGR